MMMTSTVHTTRRPLTPNPLRRKRPHLMTTTRGWIKMISMLLLPPRSRALRRRVRLGRRQQDLQSLTVLPVAEVRCVSQTTSQRQLPET